MYNHLLPIPRSSFPLAPSAMRCHLQTQLYMLNLASSHPSGFLGVQPVVPGTLLAPTTLFSHAYSKAGFWKLLLSKKQPLCAVPLQWWRPW